MVTPILFVRPNVVEVSLLDPSVKINSQSSVYGCRVFLYIWTYSVLLVDCLRCCCVTLIQHDDNVMEGGVSGGSTNVGLVIIPSCLEIVRQRRMVEGLLCLREHCRVLFTVLSVNSFLHKSNFGMSNSVLCVVLCRISGNPDCNKIALIGDVGKARILLIV